MQPRSSLRPDRNLKGHLSLEELCTAQIPINTGIGLWAPRNESVFARHCHRFIVILTFTASTVRSDVTWSADECTQLETVNEEDGRILHKWVGQSPTTQSECCRIQ